MHTDTLTLVAPRQSLVETIKKVLVKGLNTGFETLRAWQRRDGERRHLAQLDARLIADAGLPAGFAAAESAKPFWRA